MINQGTITTKETYEESGTTYQKGVEISGGEINFLPPATATNAKGHLRFFSGVQRNSKAELDLYTNGGITIACENGSVTIAARNNNRLYLSNGRNDFRMDSNGIYIDSSGYTIEIRTSTINVNGVYGYDGTVTVDGRNLQFTCGILTGVS